MGACPSSATDKRAHEAARGPGAEQPPTRVSVRMIEVLKGSKSSPHSTCGHSPVAGRGGATFLQAGASKQGVGACCVIGLVP